MRTKVLMKYLIFCMEVGIFTLPYPTPQCVGYVVVSECRQEDVLPWHDQVWTMLNDKKGSFFHVGGNIGERCLIFLQARLQQLIGEPQQAWHAFTSFPEVATTSPTWQNQAKEKSPTPSHPHSFSHRRQKGQRNQKGQAFQGTSSCDHEMNSWTLSSLTCGGSLNNPYKSGKFPPCCSWSIKFHVLIGYSCSF